MGFSVSLRLRANSDITQVPTTPGDHAHWTRFWLEITGVARGRGKANWNLVGQASPVRPQNRGALVERTVLPHAKRWKPDKVTRLHNGHTCSCIPHPFRGCVKLDLMAASERQRGIRSREAGSRGSCRVQSSGYARPISLSTGICHRFWTRQNIAYPGKLTQGATSASEDKESDCAVFLEARNLISLPTACCCSVWQVSGSICIPPPPPPSPEHWPR